METDKQAEKTVDPASERAGHIPSFSRTLARHELRLVRGQSTTLQINVGLRCNQTCRHCHLNAGPNRRENMDANTVDAVVAYARRGRFDTADITGGAPELNPHLSALITRLRPLVDTLMMRCNLSVLTDGDHDYLIDMLRENRGVIVASLPAPNASQTDSQRGGGVYQQSIDALRRLNDAGYGQPGTGLALNLVSNPTGAFMPTSQSQAEKRFRQMLARKFDITFNQLFIFGNVPLGRFRTWLKRSGNYEAYLKKLHAGFNPCAIDGLMCRSLVSVSWDGYLYDCDFNLAAGMPMGGRKVHVSEVSGPPEPGRAVAVAEHCYTCSAGAGFT